MRDDLQGRPRCWSPRKARRDTVRPWHIVDQRDSLRGHVQGMGGLQQGVVYLGKPSELRARDHTQDREHRARRGGREIAAAHRAAVGISASSDITGASQVHAGCAGAGHAPTLRGIGGRHE